jgi:hypothetical protein
VAKTGSIGEPLVKMTIITYRRIIYPTPVFGFHVQKFTVKAGIQLRAVATPRPPGMRQKAHDGRPEIFESLLSEPQAMRDIHAEHREKE